MTNVYHSLATSDFSQAWSSGAITANDDWSLVPSIIGYRTGDVTSSTGVDAQTVLTDTGFAVNVIANQAATNNTGGVIDVDQSTSNPTIGLQGSNASDYAAIVLHLDASGRQNVRFQANVRDLDASADNAAQQVNVQYRIGTSGSWTNVSGGYFADVTTASSATQVTAIDVTLPAAANNQSQLQVRVLTTNAAGNDELIGIDDIAVSSVPVGGATVAIGDVTQVEGDNGTTTFIFDVTRSNDSTAFTIDYATAPSTATQGVGAGADYAAATGQLSFAAGDGVLTKTVSVTVAGDTTIETNEQFFVNLSNLVQTSGTTTVTDAQGLGTIVNDDQPAQATVSITGTSVLEGNAGTTNLVFTVSRSSNAGDFSIDFATADGTATVAGNDYLAKTGTLNFTAGGAFSQDIIVTVNGDVGVEPDETLSVGLSNLISSNGSAVLGTAQANGTIVNDDGVITKIHEIQGTAFFSPILAAEGITAFNQASTATVTVKAVVTAIDSFVGSGTRGFYLAEEVSDWDNNPFTSEGIYVRTSAAVSGLTVGETVTVTANVLEYQAFSNLNRTFLVNPVITQDNNSVALPTLVLDGTPGKAIPNKIVSDDNPVFTDSFDDAGDTFDPANDALDFYETIEGMRVSIPNMVVADGFVGGSNDNFVFFNAYSTNHADPALLNSRGGYTIFGDPQFYPVDTATTVDDVLNGGRNNTDGNVNPDIIELDFGDVGRGGAAGFDELLTMGDSLGTVTGIVDFDFGVTKLYVTDALDANVIANLGPQPAQEVTTLTADNRSLRVATFNVENLSPVGTTFSTNNGVEITTQAKFDRLAQQIDVNLDAPDIIAIQEVQDNNGVGAGGTDASQTWEALVAAVNLATGKVYQWVDEAPVLANDVGGAPGGNIRVGFLYDTARVQLGNLGANATIDQRRQFTDRIGDGVRDAGDLIAVDDTNLGINPADWSGTRRSLVGEFTFNGQTVYAFNSHLPSKGGSGDFFQLNQNNAAGAPANGDWDVRVKLAEDLYQVQNRASLLDPENRIVSGGDFNEFWFYRPMEVATGYATENGVARVGGTRYANLMVDKLAPAERFSYDFDGRSQNLDGLLSDQALAAVAEYDSVHVSTGYNDRTGGNSPAASDHDPSLARFDFRNFSEVLTGTAAAETIFGFGGDDTISTLGGDDLVVGNDGNDQLQGGAGDDDISGGAGIDTAVFEGAWRNFDIFAGPNAGETVVSDRTGVEGADSLFDVEFVRFNGVSVGLVAAVNEAPTGVNDSNAGDPIVEDLDALAAGNVLANDTDADLALGLGETLQVSAVATGTEANAGTFNAVVVGGTTVNGTYGSLLINRDGSYSYVLDNSRAATQALNAGQTATESFTYRVTDVHGLEDMAELNLAITGASDVYTLQLLHLSDGEAGTLAPDTAPYLAALADRFEDQYANSITLAGGDTYIPGPFLAAGTDPSVLSALNTFGGASFAASAVAPIAAADTLIHNIIGVEASGIGNHEWDLGSNVYAASITPATGYPGANYVSLTANLNFNPGGGIPADAINARFTQTVGVGGLEEASSLKGRVAPSAVITEGGEKIGLVGVTTQVLESISSPTGAEVIGFPFGPGPNGESDNMALLATQLQPVINDLRNQGVNKIVLLSHLQLLSNERTLATLLEGVDIILAAGSNTRLGDADDVAVAFPGHGATFADTYPIVTQGADGATTLIVNTDNEYTYLGRLVVDFDSNGQIILDSLVDNVPVNGAYAATAATVAEAYGVDVADVDTSAAFAAGSKGARVKGITDAVDTVIQVKDGNIFGYSNVYLEGDRTAVRTQESNLGNLTADANADALRDVLGAGDTDFIVSFKNGGGIRAQIGEIQNNPDGTVTKLPPSVGGEVSQLDVENSLRFNNALMTFDTTPAGLKALLEHGVGQTAPGATPGRFPQIGGISFSFDPTKPVGSRVSDIAIINENDQIIAKLYDDGVAVAGAPATIKVITLNFLANGGDGYPTKANGENFRYILNDGTLGPVLEETVNFEAARPANALGEIQALQEYFQERYPTPDKAFDQADTPVAGDLRIQNTTARTDTVFNRTLLLFGDETANSLNGTASGDELRGKGGNDTINAAGGNDTINGGTGNDSLNGDAGDDVIEGGAGGDRINGGDGIDTASYAGAAGGVSASLYENRGFFGDASGDRFTGVENLSGSAFGDALEGNSQVNTLRGGDGNDTISGRGGLDQLFGEGGDDVFTFEGNLKFASIDGGTGNDSIVATDDDTTINWGAITGVETISADGFANVRLLGTTAGDTIDLGGIALDGIAAVDGGGGNDSITGSAGADRLQGGGGNDTVVGGNGNDSIVGGAGTDVLTGGAGNDNFIFVRLDTVSTLSRADVITDFASGDRIDLSGWDAIAATGADDAFDFIGTAAFEIGVAGQLRYDDTSAGVFRLFGDTNGDARADFAIVLNNVTSLSDADFIL